MRLYNLYQIDAFTDKAFWGNPAGVITNADGLTEYEMQAIARELNNSETAFIFQADADEFDIKIRYFTPTNEVPVCGHATIAAHYARAIELGLQKAKVNQMCGAGILPIDVMKVDNQYKITMTQGMIEFGKIVSGQEKVALLEALGLKAEDLIENVDIQIVSTGHSKVFIGVKSREKLYGLKVNHHKLKELSEVIGSNGYYVFTINTSTDSCLIDGRMFAPAIGIDEDPVTGNANGPLGALLVKEKLVSYEKENFRFRARQGLGMGRLGHIDVNVLVKDDKPTGVKITGTAHIVYQTQLSLD